MVLHVPVRIQSEVLEAEYLPEQGARLHRLRAFGHDVLKTPEHPRMYHPDPFFWGGYVMAPWCNRLASGSTVIGGRRIRPMANYPDGSAIHGQVFARTWRETPDGAVRVTGIVGGWPWRYSVRLKYEVRLATFRVRLSLKNNDTEPMPAGLGFHPWFARPLALTIPAATVFRRNTLIPGAAEPVAGRFDLRTGGLVPDDLDATWTDFDGPVRLRWPHLGLAAQLSIEAPSTYLAVASPLGLNAVAIEPQSHAPAGLSRLLAGSPGGLAMLQPGATLDLVVELTFEQTG